MGSTWGSTPRAVGRLVRRVRAACPLPIIAKLTPNVTDIVPIAAAAAEAGADAVSLINTAPRHGRRLAPPAADPGLRRRRTLRARRSSRSRCGWSGRSPAPCPDLPVIGIGGIATADDALEFLVAGASAVQVGTATFYDPTASERLLDDLTIRLDEAGVTNLRQIIGTLQSNREIVTS